MGEFTDKQLYEAHLNTLMQRYDDALAHAKLDAVLITAGIHAAIFLDDQQLPFKPNPHLLQWAPLLQHPDAILSYQRGSTPELLIYAPTDYWHQTAPIPELLTLAPVNVRIISDGMKLYDHAQTMPRKTAFIGEICERGDSFGISKVNPEKLLNHLHYLRSFKTPWEVACIREATRKAVPGHLAAEQCFAAGGSEYEIHQAYRAACQITDLEMPYPAIVALNEHAATLHYQFLDREPTSNQSLLIDAGCAVNGYASDITRTYTNNSEFGALIAAMHNLQQDLCKAALPGRSFKELHQDAHQAIAELLAEAGIINCPADEAIENQLTQTFFPHGLGHYLGLQVHDVGADMVSPDKPVEDSKNAKDSTLRLSRKLEAGNVLTIEPGLYFIEALLTPLRESAVGAYLNWNQIAELLPCGGIRIEDNLHITPDGNENLTREAFAELG
jgi:Xaa-Pro dipeptidase